MDMGSRDMDFEKMLSVYLKHVANHEGVTFVDPARWGMPDGLTPEEEEWLLRHAKAAEERRQAPEHGPKHWRLKFWNAPEGDKRFDPWSSPFPDMPSDVFPTREAAQAAAEAYVAKYVSKGGGSHGGWNEEDDLYWIRDAVAPDRFRFTRFEIASER
jgi:hypothetical protein